VDTEEPGAPSGAAMILLLSQFRASNSGKLSEARTTSRCFALTLMETTAAAGCVSRQIEYQRISGRDTREPEQSLLFAGSAVTF
jgi:hypothetical protein